MGQAPTFRSPSPTAADRTIRTLATFTIDITATEPVIEEQPRQTAKDVSPVQNQLLADCSCGSANSQKDSVRVSHATSPLPSKAKTRPIFPNTKVLKARRSHIQVTLTNGRRLKLRTAIRK